MQSSECSSKKEVCSNTRQPQEARKILKKKKRKRENLTLFLKKSKKGRMNKTQN